MGFKIDNKEKDKWYEIMVGWKWPHEGFTVGYDLIEPNQNPEPDEMLYCAFLLYLGCVSVVFNWGKHSWNE